MKKINCLFVTIVWSAGCMFGTARAEVGLSLGLSFGQKASFSSEQLTVPRATDPGAATAGIDHFYDDGFNRVDSSGNFANQTTFWGYQNDSQYDASGSGTITMNSTETTVGPSRSSGTGDGLPSLELYWQKNFSENERWNYGIKLAGRWQRIKVDGSSASDSTMEIISDTYELNGVIPPSAPFEGSYAGPNAFLGDTPTRNITTTAGDLLQSSRTVEGHLLGFDFGPSASVSLSERFDVTGSLGGTLAYAHSTFSYRDGNVASGSTSDNDWLLGLYAGADLQYRVGDDWGIFGGTFYNYLQGLTQEVDNRKAELDFDGVFGIRIGFYSRH